MSIKLCPSGQSTATSVGYLHIADFGDAVDGQKAGVVWRERVFGAGVSETDDKCIKQGLGNRDQGTGGAFC